MLLIYLCIYGRTDFHYPIVPHKPRSWVPFWQNFPVSGVNFFPLDALIFQGCP